MAAGKLVMRKIDELAQRLHADLKEASIRCDLAPADSPSPSWIDIDLGGRRATVEWRPDQGFGISLFDPAVDPPHAGLFEGPEATFDDLADAHRFLLEGLTG